jgi:hypothetical protein
MSMMKAPASQNSSGTRTDTMVRVTQLENHDSDPFVLVSRGPLRVHRARACSPAAGQG